jgi:thymidylate synthase
MQHPEQQYLDLISKTITEGIERDDRTGVGTKSIWGASMRFDLQKGFPLFTTRFIAPRIAIEEMLFFMRGQTDTKLLEEKNIKIWAGNTSREFLDKRGLSHLPDGDMGKMYGYQMRNFGGTGDFAGSDQLKYVINNIKTNPNDRRHLISFYNPNQAHEGVLFPCHIMFFFQVVEGKLNGLLMQRSGDGILGIPTNVAGYAFFLCVIAKLTGLQPGDFVHQIADFHVYKNHIEGAKELVTKEPKPFPTINFKKEISTLEEALELSYSDIEILGYEHCGKMSFPMAI